jgi:hypothetical protein
LSAGLWASSLVGLHGLLRAARLSPIDAIRYE